MIEEGKASRKPMVRVVRPGGRIAANQSTYVATLQALKGMGLPGVLSFMIRAYPKILLQLLRDARIREAGRIHNQITKRTKEYMGYVLIVGQKNVKANRRSGQRVTRFCHERGR